MAIERNGSTLSGWLAGGLFMVPLGACAPNPAEKGSPSDAGFPQPGLLADNDPEEGAFEASLRAATLRANITGEPTDFLAYNGEIPGPLVRVAQGDTVHIQFHNNLPGTGGHEHGEDWASGIHWHGIEGYNAADGTPVTQSAVATGDSFDYHFRAERAGTFWYHPHIRGAQALFSGLYGPLVVEDPDEARLVEEGILPEDDRVVVLSDTWTLLGQVSSAEVDDAMEIMNGTEGRDLLVNGRVNPTLPVRVGAGVRLRLINASITRFWRLEVPGHRLVRVGGEGGLLDYARVEGGDTTAEQLDPTSLAVIGTTTLPTGYAEGELLLAPGERADVVLETNGTVGEEWPLLWKDFARGRHGMWMEGDEMVMGDAEDDGSRPAQEVARFRIIAGPDSGYTLEPGAPILAAVGRETRALDTGGAIQYQGPDAVTLDEEMSHTVAEDGTVEMSTWFGMNGEDWHGDHSGPTQPHAPNARYARLGDTIQWEVRNNSEMYHPYHLHGFSYQPRAILLHPDDPTEPILRIPWTHTEFEDTTLIPGHASLLFDVHLADPAGDGSAAGRWMQHCHILQHGENGMMSELIVVP